MGKARCTFTQRSIGLAITFFLWGAHAWGEEALYPDKAGMGVESLEQDSQVSQNDVIFDDSIDLELAQARLLLEQKKYDDGLARLNTLLETHPDNIELIKMKAYTLSSLRRSQEALNFLEEAEKRFPNNKELKDVRDDIQDGQKDEEYIALEGEYRKVGSSRKEYFGFLKGRVRIATFTFIGLDAQHDRLYAREITRPKNGIVDTHQVNRQKADVFVEHYFDGGHALKAGIYGAQSTLGGHVGFTLLDRLGSTTFEGKLRRPDWDYTETVVFNGTRDTISIMRVLKFTDALEITGEGGLDNYNVDGVDAVAQAFHVLGRIAYTFYSKKGYEFIPGNNTSITLSYTFDGDYPYRRKNRVGPTGGYPVLGIDRAENHGLELYLSTSLTPDLEAALFGGYSVSRFARNVPFAGTYLEYKIRKKVKLGFEYEHTVDAADRGEQVDRFKAKLKYVFN